MKSNFIELHQDGESIFINKNMIVSIYTSENAFEDHLGSTIIECLRDCLYDVDENINEVMKCLE